jgi:simple sugar transport system ATP-binding protein
MVRCIYGADRSHTGSLTFKSKKMKMKAPIDAIKAGMGYLPDDRKEDGLISELSVKENIILALQARNGIFKMMSRDKQEKLADEFIELLQIKTASRETIVSQLSGGNQQKVILARWLCTKPDFLILDEPTRGIDVGTKTEFQKLILKYAADGMSIVFISSEIEEMLRTCSRMCVMRDGEKVSEISGLMTQENVMNAIAGGE